MNTTPQAALVEALPEKDIKDIANGLNGLPHKLGQWQRDLLVARAVEAKVRAALAQAEAAQPVAGWQPIETAPRDGTLVMLWEQFESEPFIGLWNIFRGRWVASTQHYDTDGDACVIDRVYSDGVTHWMPIPAAPQTPAPGAEGGDGA